MNHQFIALVMALAFSFTAKANGVFGESQSSIQENSSTCSSSGVPEEVRLDSLDSAVNKTKCEIVNERNTCSQTRNIDQRRRELFSSSLTALDDAYKKTNGNLVLRNNSSQLSTDIEAQMPGANLALRKTAGMVPRNGARLEDISDEKYRLVSRQTNVQLKSYYHQYLERSGNADKFSEQKENFVDDYMEFEQEFECQRGVEVGVAGTMATAPASIARDSGMTSCEENEQIFKRKLDANKAKFTDYYKENYSDKNGLDKGMSCNDKLEYRKLTVVAYEQRSCAGRFEQLFSDNEWDMNISSLSSDPEYNKFKDCIDKMQAEGFVLTNVSINSSSSQLNNTGKAGQQFCKKGFLELSTARAESARNLLASNFAFPTESISINARGRNGNGSSGECPYSEVNGAEVLKPEFRHGGSGRADLDDAKYVKVSVNFEPKSKPAQREKSCYQAYINCSKVTYKCGEWSRPDTSWGVRQAYKRKRASIPEED